MSNLAMLPPAVRSYVRGYVLRQRRLAAVRGAGLAACVFLGIFLAACIADRFVQFPPALRLTLLAIAGLLAVALLLRPLLRLSRPDIDWLAVAEQIESRDDRYGQRLQTVASRLLGEQSYRGSDEMLEKLSYELDREAVVERPSRLLPARSVLGPWLAVLILAAVALSLLRLPDINLPQLGLRFLTPWRPIDPVTTTQLVILPGDRDLPQSTPITIEASARRLGGGLVWLHLAEVNDDSPDEAPTWQKFPMAVRDLPVADAATRPVVADEPIHFTYTLTSIDRDVRYYITAGDARSHTHTLRALRKPAVAEFRVRYIYPPHTGRPPVSFTSADGKLEAPAGTEAEITIVSTEPLKSALLTFAGETLAMTRPADDATGRHRQGRVVMSRDGRIDLGLVSTREQAGVGPATAEIKAMPDRAPIVRVGSTGQILRLGPRDILPISFEALDDFGIETLVLRAQVGSAAAVDFPVAGPADVAATTLPATITRPLDLRRREGLYELDLARLPLAVGDIVTLVLSGRDTSNQFAASDAIHVLVSPRSIGIDMFELISELDAAALLAASTADDLQEAAKRIAAADGGTSLAGGRTSRRFASAASAAALVRRALVRGIGRDPPTDLSAAMLAWVDEAQTLAASAEVCFRELGGEPRDAAASPRSQPAPQDLIALTRQLAEVADRLADQLRVVRDGLRARVALADIDNAAVADKRGPPKPTGVAATDKAASDRHKQSLGRLREDIAALGKSLGLQPGAGDFKQKLQGLADRGDGVARGRSRVDYLQAVRDWSPRVQRNSWHPIVLDERLSAAAQAEAVRPGGDVRVARDYNLASRAAAAIEASGDRSRPVPVSPASANAYVAAFEAIVREHGVFRRPVDVRMEAEAQTIAANAERARQLMEQWCGPMIAAVPGNPPATMPTTTPAMARSAALEMTALAAGAAAADRDYRSADQLDAALSRQLSPTGAPADLSSQAMEKARRATGSAAQMDAAQQKQQDLIARTSQARAEDAPTLAEAQRQLANGLSSSGYRGGLASAGGPSGSYSARDKAAESLVTAQNQLVAMPEQLAAVLDADATHRQAADRARRAREEADRAPPEQRAAASRVAEMAAAEQASAAAQLQQRLQSLSPAVGQSMLLNIDGATGMSAAAASGPAIAARDAIGSQLTPALRNLADALSPKGNRPAADEGQAARAAAELRQAIDAAQIAVARSQEELALQDPLTSARWYSRAAADALSRRPPDFRAAERSQKSAIALLSRARDDTLRYASGQRMLAIRSARPVVVAAAETPAGKPTDPPAAPISAWQFLTGEFRRLRPREMDDATGLLHRADPPGYEAALKAYFEAIEKK